MTTVRHQISLPSPFGILTLTSDGHSITALDWGAVQGVALTSSLPLLNQAVDQLNAYFSGSLTQFELPLAASGSAFQRRIWNGLCQIPYGVTWTYGQLARHCDTAARAVGGACGANPIPIIIPCHRILAATGPGGYSGLGGLATKNWLLRLEGVPASDLFARHLPDAAVI